MTHLEWAKAKKRLHAQQVRVETELHARQGESKWDYDAQGGRARNSLGLLAQRLDDIKQTRRELKATLPR